MGRSSDYCFKIIACGGNSESVDRDDLDASSENKDSDKKRWSFRKKSFGHQNNTVITEITSSENKTPVFDSSTSEKTYANQWTQELPRVSTSTTKGNTVLNFVTDASDQPNIKFDLIPHESFFIVIQTAVRKFLAQKELARHKKAVKLQAIVRGHLVRCRAAGTLRCIQAIVKMQTLVRARLSFGKSFIGIKGIEDSRIKPHPTYISIEKLLSNRFAIQLLESTPRTKQINIKCDPSKDDSSWKWMERWTAVSSPEVIVPHQLKHEVKVNDTKNQTENVIFDQQSDFLSAEINRLNTGSETGSKSRFKELTSNNNSLTSVKPTKSSVYESLRVGQRQSQSQTGRSECGTQLSITSMLDSPNPSEKTPSHEEHHDLSGTELTRSILTVNTELQETPSRSNKKDSSQKPKSWSNSQRSSLTFDHLARESKPGKRRSSFGSQTSDQVDQELTSYIPSYMQVTESARAKTLANSSPRLSPDVLGRKEAYIKKRHSLPGMKSAPPQPQLTMKGNDNRDRKWQN